MNSSRKIIVLGRWLEERHRERILQTADRLGFTCSFFDVILTPHVAGNMTIQHTKDRLVEMFCENLENYGAGRTLVRRVDRKRGY